MRAPASAVRVFLPLLLASFCGCTLFRPIRPPPQPLHVAPPSAATIEVHWIGHATALIRMHDRWLITDPNFSDRVGLMVKRFVAPAIAAERLPAVDAVLISHGHMDHLDHPSLEKLNRDAQLLVPAGLDPGEVPFATRHPLAPWQTMDLDGMRITAVPVNHAGGRWLVDSLWNDAYSGYVIEYRGATLFFAGDTAAAPELFTRIGDRFDIDVALIPAGPAAQSWPARLVTRSVHADPSEALAIFSQLNAKCMVPIHHSTFYYPPEAERRAIASAASAHPLAAKLVLLQIGQGVGWFEGAAANTGRCQRLATPPPKLSLSQIIPGKGCDPPP